LEKPQVAGRKIWAVGGLTNLGDAMFGQKGLHESCTMGRRIVVMKLICSLVNATVTHYTISVNDVSLPTD
jgi:hypothetical protein